MTVDLDSRLAALAEAAELAGGRLDAAGVEDARAVVERAGVRLGLGVGTTVVALAGPTGAGKSTLFNALAGRELVAASVRRPTTSTVTAAVWEPVDPALLDWLRAASRHTMDGAGPDAFVLLDLPDYDSVETSHRLEVERVIELVDLLVWVLDPQKYADAALHRRYLQPLSAYGEAMVVVLNQADRLAPDALAACRADIGRLLAADGLPDVPVLAVSALHGSGIGDLRRLLRERASARAAAAARLAADVRTAAARLAGACEGGRASGVSRGDRARLVDALSHAAGVPVVVDAVARSHRRRGALAAGWPYARWLGRLRPDPLRRLGLGDRAAADAHTSIPRATGAQRGEVVSAVRTLAANAAGELPEPWPGLVRTAALRREGEIPERLDRAVAAVDLRPRRPRWWAAAAALQRLLALVAAAGLLWLVAIAALGFIQLEDALPLPEIEGFPLPTLLLTGGVLGGLLLALLARRVNAVAAARRARAAGRSLRAAVEDVADELAIEPVRAELSARDRLCGALARASPR